MDVKYDANTKIADSKREFEMNQAAYQREVNAAVSGSMEPFFIN